MFPVVFFFFFFAFNVTIALQPSNSAKVVIVGAGPTGLASALMFQKHGYNDITIIEKRSRMSFESEKAYLYMVAPNGLKIIDYLNFTNKISEVAVSSYNFRTLKVVETTGKVETKSLPVRTVGKEKFWLPRSSLLDVMLNEVEIVNRNALQMGGKPAIKLLFSSQCEINAQINSESLCVKVYNEESPTDRTVLSADVLVGADGINSGY